MATPELANGTRAPGREAVKSASRTIDILEVLAEKQGRLTLSELQRVLDVPKSSLYQLLQTLVARGWVETDERGTAYTIGLRALRVGGALLERDPVVQAVGPLLARVGKQLDETIHLGRLESADIVYLASRESEHHLRVSSRIGRRLPAHATALGKSLLAARPWNEVDALLPAELTAVTSKTVTDRAALQSELDDTRVRGWAIEREQTTLGLTCFAVAVPTHHPPINSLSCPIPLSRWTEEHQSEVVHALSACAIELAQLVRHSL